MKDTMPCPLCQDPMEKKDVSGDSVESDGPSPVLVRYLNMFRYSCRRCGASWLKHGGSFRRD